MFRDFPFVAISRTWLVITYLVAIALLAMVSGEL